MDFLHLATLRGAQRDPPPSLGTTEVSALLVVIRGSLRSSTGLIGVASETLYASLYSNNFPSRVGMKV